MGFLQFNTLDNIVWVAYVVTLGVLYFRLVWNGLFRRYRSFSLLIALLAIRAGALSLLQGGVTGFYVWFATEPVVVLAYTLAVFEMYNLALRRYHGIRTATRRILMLAIVVASFISIFSIFPDLQYGVPSGEDWVLLLNVIRRGVYTSLLAFLVLLVSFVAIFPVRLSRNALVHVIIFFVSFLFYVVSNLLLNVVGLELVPVINMIAAAVGLLCGIAWCLFLTPAGENVEASMPSRLSQEQANMLLNKLKEVNDSLSDSGKRF
jgi:hypothetical protein